MKRNILSLVVALALIGPGLSACSTTGYRMTEERRPAPRSVATLGALPLTGRYTALSPEVNNEGIAEATSIVIDGGVVRLVGEP